MIILNDKDYKKYLKDNNLENDEVIFKQDHVKNIKRRCNIIKKLISQQNDCLMTEKQKSEILDYSEKLNDFLFYLQDEFDLYY